MIVGAEGEVRSTRGSVSVLEALQSCACDLHQEYLTLAQYREWRAAELSAEPEKQLPDVRAIQRQFGDFASALADAGLKTSKAHRAESGLEYVDEATGLDQVGEQVVAYALSRLIGVRYGGERTYAYELCRLLGPLADVEGPRPGGAWPTSKSVIKWLGLGPALLDTEWNLVADGSRRLPDRLLKAFIPPRLWGELHTLIDAGPSDAWDRASHLLRLWAIGLEPDGSPRESSHIRSTTLAHGGLSEGAINNLTTALFGLMKELAELQRLEEHEKLQLPSGSRYFGKWSTTALPRWESAGALGATPAATVRDAPSLRFVRLVLQILCLEIEEMQKRPPSARLFTLLRDRAVIATLVVTGMRRGACTRLTVGDIKDAFDFPDGEKGRAIIVRPGKSLNAKLERPKGIPDSLYAWIREYADHAGIWGDEESPLWLKSDVASRTRREPVDEQVLNYIVRVRFARPEDTHTRQVHPLYTALAEEHDGRVYSPHQLRHAAEQLGYMAGMDWLEAHRETLLQAGSGLPANPQVFPDALLDHKMGGMGDLYKDVASERGRMKWARKCALGIGNYVVGEKGARRGPDRDLVREKSAALERAEARQAEIEAQLDLLEDRLITHGDALEVKDILLGNVQMLRLARQLAPLAQATERARAELEDARKVRVAVPDHLTKSQVEAPQEMDDPSTLVAEQDDDAEMPVVRDWASLEEFHWALGGHMALSIETLRRWARGEKTKLASLLGLPSGAAGANDGRPSCVERISDRKQKILLDRLNWSRLPTQVQENLDAIRRLPADAPSPALESAAA